MNNEATATLVAHSKKFQCEMATREQLARYETPERTSSWVPVPHIDLVEAITGQLPRFGLKISREQFAVGSKGLSLFGIMELSGVFEHAKRAMALGFRHSNNKALALRMVAGSRVFVCDNLALGGEAITFRKHTSLLDLARTIRNGLGKFLDSFRRFDAKIVAAESLVLTDDQAKIKLVDLWRNDALPISLFSQAHDNYFKAEALQYEDSAPRTAWGLHNACTRAVKALAPTTQFTVLNRLGQEFGLA